MAPAIAAAGTLPATLPPTLKIDFISDAVCPWCAIGLAAPETFGAASRQIAPAGRGEQLAVAVTERVGMFARGRGSAR